MKDINWIYLWEIIRDIVLPHIGRLVFNIVIFTVIGLIISIILLVIMGKKKVLTRVNKIYKIIIRIIYIPSIIVVCLFFFAQIGLFRGIYRVLTIENPRIVNGIYTQTINQIFSSEQEKETFLLEMKDAVKLTEDTNEKFSNQLIV